MSNPGVVTLEDFRIHRTLPVRVEDNLAENIHIHVGPFRLDMSLAELHELADSAVTQLNRYLTPFGLSTGNFDSEFLAEIAPMLLDLEAAEFVKVRVADLLVTKRSRLGIKKIVRLGEGSVVAALRGDSVPYRRIRGIDNQSALDRIDSVVSFVEKGKYGDTGERVILFNNQLLIRDGQHRASAIYNIDPNADIEVLRIKFKDSAYNIHQPLILESLKNLSLRGIKKKLVFVMNYISHFKRRVASKANRIRNRWCNGPN